MYSQHYQRLQEIDSSTPLCQTQSITDGAWVRGLVILWEHYIIGFEL